MLQHAAVTADAIVVLGGDATGSRIDHAVLLVKSGYLRANGLFVVSGGQLYADVTWSGVMAERATQPGIPPSQVLRQAASLTTAEDADHSGRLLMDRGAQSVLLVTSAWHSGRAYRLFRQALPETVSLRSCPAKQPGPQDWWTDAATTRALATEWLKRIWPGPGS